MLAGILARFSLGLGGAVATGMLAFRMRIFDPTDPAFACITVGGLAAGVLALLRASRPGQAVALAAAFALFRLGLVDAVGWIPAAAGIVIAAGVLIIGWIFDLLARQRIRFGKFLIVGPLLGGLYLAVAPMLEFHTLTPVGAVRTFLHYIFLGLVVGDGVAFGVEIADLFVHFLERGADGRA